MGIGISTLGVPETDRLAKLKDASKPERKPLHVLTLTPFYPTIKNGAQGCFVVEPLPALSKLDTISTVIAVYPFYRSDSIANMEEFSAQQVRFLSLPGNFGLPAAGALLFAKLLRIVRRLHGVNPIHMIHAHAALPCGHAAALLARELAIPFAVTVHGLDAYSTEQVSGLSGIWSQRVSNFVYRSANCVVCISEKVRDRVLAVAKGPIKTEVVYNGVDVKKFRSEIDGSEASTILCAANLIPIKGHDILLKAFASVQAEFPSWSCELIGDGPEKSKLESTAAKLKVRVIFKGRRSRTEVAEAMRRCAIFALPSTYEGLGCVYLEAMASGKPAIGCWKQGIEEVIEHRANGWLVNAGSIQELGDALRELMSDPQLRATIGKEARRTILRGFTLDHQAERLAKIYRECAG